MKFTGEDIRHAFEVNDLEVATGTTYPELLASLGMDNAEAIYDVVAERLETLTDQDAEVMGSILDGLTAGLRACRMVALGATEK